MDANKEKLFSSAKLLAMDHAEAGIRLGVGVQTVRKWKREKFLSTPKLIELPNNQAALRLGVVQSCISYWKREAGIARASDEWEEKRQQYINSPELRAMTYSAAAKELGVNQSTVSNWNAGEKRPTGRKPSRLPPRPRLSKAQIRAAKKIRRWKRPTGIDKHLEDIRDFHHILA